MRSTRSLLALAALALVASTASAQVGTLSNGPVTVTLNATQAPTLTLGTSAASTSTVSTINPGTTTDFTPINVTATWNLTAGASIALIGWFATPAQALTGTGGNIASARVEGRTGSAAYTAFVNNPVGVLGTTGGTATLWTVAATPLNGTATTNLDLRLNYTSQLPPNAGAYTGTLNLRAVVQ